MDESEDGDDVPILLEKYNAQIGVIFQHHAKIMNGERMNNENFIQALNDCGFVPNPLPTTSANRIFNSSLRGRSDQLLDFDSFVECLERCSLMAFAEDPTSKSTLSPAEAMIRLLQAIARSRAYERCGGAGDFLLPEHHLEQTDVAPPAQSNDEDEEESIDDAEEWDGERGPEDGIEQNEHQSHQVTDPKSTPTASELTPRETDALLRDLFAYYCAPSDGEVPAGGGATGRRMGAGRFYKMVRECRVTDSRVTQAEVGAVYKQVSFRLQRQVALCMHRRLCSDDGS
jgi:hypothetical protein